MYCHQSYLEVDDVLPAGGALVHLVPGLGQVVAQVVEVPLGGPVPVDDQGARLQVDVVQLGLGVHESQLEIGCKIVQIAGLGSILDTIS